MKYMKKLIIVDAVQRTGNNIEEIKSFLDENGGVYTITSNGFIISTLEGDMLASLGDYIIKGVHGELYPCKPDIFKETYDQVNIEIKGKVNITDNDNTKIIYNKIVRDNVPEIIKEKHEKAIVKYRVITDKKELIKALCNKLIEEVNELAEASDEIDSEYMSELCDVHDILNEIDSISIDNAEDARKLHAVRRDKVGKRGKFENHIFLESVEYENK